MNNKYIENIALLFQFEKINDYLNLTSRERIEFNDCVYEALEKQVAKKIINLGGNEVKRMACPVCKCDNLYELDLYCTQCGQRLE